MTQNTPSKTGKSLSKTVSDTLFQPNIRRLPDNVSTELLIYGQSKPDVISLAQGDGNLATPAFICDAASQAMREGKTHYGPALGQPALRKEISNYYKNIYQSDIDAERIFITGSGTTALHLALTSLLKEGDEVVCITPIWRNIMGIIGLTGGTAIEVPLEFSAKDGWSLDLEKIRAACSKKTKAILVVSPSNPTGWIMPEEQMKSILSLSREKGLWLVADEVYNRMTFDQRKAKSFLELANTDDLLYSVNSFSKTWAMTGWRLGWLVAPPIAKSVVQNIALYEDMCPPTFNQYGALSALQKGEAFIEEQKSLWQSNLDIIEERFKNNKKIIFFRPKSTFYAFFQIKGEQDCVAICRRLIDEAGVSLAPGCSFGKGFEGWIRMCFAVSEEKLIEALDRIESVLP